ncbi:hypothetical protein BVX93_01000 [bacterium B13(2017)]|nr:hypothetical protein BVX93_01000 [bacterium B13(2017)]
MSLPVGHSLAGYIFYDYKPLLFFNRAWHSFLFIVMLSNLPDIDFLPGLIVGEPNLYHHGISHSLGAALVVGIIFGFIFKKKTNFFTVFFFTSSIYYSHVLIDFFTEDLRKPIGIMLFWPLNDIYYSSPVPLFAKTIRASTTKDFFPSLFNLHNFLAIIREVIVMSVVILIYRFIKKIFRPLKR